MVQHKPITRIVWHGLMVDSFDFLFYPIVSPSPGGWEPIRWDSFSLPFLSESAHKLAWADCVSLHWPSVTCRSRTTITRSLVANEIILFSFGTDTRKIKSSAVEFQYITFRPKCHDVGQSSTIGQLNKSGCLHLVLYCIVLYELLRKKQRCISIGKQEGKN